MERVTFLIEPSGERLACLLNPDTLTWTRRAGVRPRTGAGGAVAARGLRDDPLIEVGGGATELALDLLFDMSVVGSDVVSEDVRDLTRPLWDLADAPAASDGGRPRVVQFFWGKREGFPGVVMAVAERLEHFTSEGVPRRSWLRMRLRRAPRPRGAADAVSADGLDGIRTGGSPPDARDVGRDVVLGPLAGAGEGSRATGGVSRLDAVAALYFGDASLWRWVASWNDVDDPARLGPDVPLRLPPAPPADAPDREGAP